MKDWSALLAIIDLETARFLQHLRADLRQEWGSNVRNLAPAIGHSPVTISTREQKMSTADDSFQNSAKIVRGR